MSVGIPSDSVATGEGMAGQGSPGMADSMGQPMPTGEANAATTDQFGDVSAPPDAAEEQVFSDDDLAFLQSDDVRQWFASNLPQGFHTEEQFQQHKAQLQSTLQSQADARIQAAERQAQEQNNDFMAQRRALTAALQHEWSEAGLDDAAIQQRTQQVVALADRLMKDQRLQTFEGNSQRNAEIAGYAQSIYGDLRGWGVQVEQNASVNNAVRDHLGKLQRGEFGNDHAAIQQANSQFIRSIVQSQQQAAQPQQPQQPQVQQPAPQVQPQNQRPSPGPMQSVRGAGRAGSRSFEDIYDAEEQKLIEQYGDKTKVPNDKWDEIFVNANMTAAGFTT